MWRVRSSLALKRAHNPKVVGSNPTPATTDKAQEIKNSRTQNHAWLLDIKPNNPMIINPGTAAKYRIKDGDEVWIESPYGRVKATARVTTRIHTEVVGVQHGFGHTALERLAKGRGTSDSALRPTKADPLSGQALHKEACVRWHSGSSRRHGIALVGPSVNIGARLLKHAPLGSIIASGEVVAELQERDGGELAADFRPLDEAFAVPGGDGLTVATYVVPPAPAAAATVEKDPCRGSSELPRQPGAMTRAE